MKHFTINELCATTHKGIPNIPDATIKAKLTALVDNVLDPAREWYGKPIKINSGYRCPKLNAAVGGVPTSQHQKGEAADITTGTVAENARLYDYIRTHLPYDQLINEYGFKWIHVSFRASGNRHQTVVVK